MKRLIFAAMLAAAPAAIAHETKGAHGGAVVDAGEYHVELVAKGTTIDLFLTDGASKDVAAQQFKGTAILVIEGKAQRIALTPAGGNRLTGTAPAPLPAAPKGAVQIQTPNGTTIQGKF